MRRLLTLVPVLSLAGCFYPADRGRALEVRVDRLLSENAQLASRAEASEQKLTTAMPRLDEKIAEVTTALENLDKASRRSGADIGVQMQKSLEDVARLRGEVETYLHKITELETGLAKLSTETDQKFLALKGEEAVKAAEARRRAEELKRPTDPQGFFELAAEKAKAGDRALARQLFGEFLKKWPKDTRVPEVHFELGETHRADDRCREALPEYGKVIQEYAKAKVAPEALLRSSDCFEKLKMVDEAKLALEELVKGYPKSPEAKTAKARLATLAKKGKK